jgi:hypothetical protein
MMAASATAAWAQSATAAALEDFSRYVEAAAAVFGELALGLRSADAGTLRGESARQALAEVQSGLRTQTVANGFVVTELQRYREYATAPRAGDAPRETLARLWSTALEQVSETAAVVRRVTVIVDESAALRSVLTDDQQVALRDTLAMREVILARLTALPPPTTADELSRLDTFIDSYGRLIEALRQIRVALNRALRE